MARVILAVALLLVAVSSAEWAQEPGPAPLAQPTLSGPLTFAATGDSILLRPIGSFEKDPGFAAVRQLVSSADVAFTNFEFTVFDLTRFAPFAQAEHGGLHVHGAPERASDMRWLGIDLVSRANNHAMDYGLEGMNETTEILDRVGLVHAGVGPDLGRARAPAYLQTPAGRVALVSTASSFTPLSRAGHARRDMKGRPGLSPLRWTRRITLDSTSYERLRDTIRQTDLVPANSLRDDRLSVFGTDYHRGERNRSELIADERDVREILAQVRSARRLADFVIVTIHAHEPGNRSETPADFLPAFARAAIDAGADLFIGHGPHQLRAIEIYKGRPIFYSLGNFFFQYQTLEPIPSDIFESHGLDPLAATVGELFEAIKTRPLGFPEAIWWESVVATVRFEGNRLSAIELHPIDLGTTLPGSQKGTPRKAPAELGKTIIDRVTRLSAPHGTQVRYERGIGVIDLR